MRQELVDWAKGKVAAWQQPASRRTGSGRGGTGCRRTWARSEPLKQYSFPASDPAAERRPLELTRLDLLRPAFQPPAICQQASRQDSSARTHTQAGRLRYDAARTPRPAGQEHASVRPPQALQIHNRYLVTETQEGVTIIDQHALHERILFEQLRAGSTPGPWRRRICWCPNRST